MIKLAPMVLLAALPGSAQAEEECPALLILRVPDLPAGDVEVANRYAECVRRPSLPMGSQLAGRLSQCQNQRPTAPGEKLGKALDWVDHIGAQFPGCETRLEIEKK
jgi:hypothetical protein